MLWAVCAGGGFLSRAKRASVFASFLLKQKTLLVLLVSLTCGYPHGGGYGPNTATCTPSGHVPCRHSPRTRAWPSIRTSSRRGSLGTSGTKGTGRGRPCSTCTKSPSGTHRPCVPCEGNAGTAGDGSTSPSYDLACHTRRKSTCGTCRRDGRSDRTAHTPSIAPKCGRYDHTSRTPTRGTCPSGGRMHHTCHTPNTRQSESAGTCHTAQEPARYSPDPDDPSDDSCDKTSWDTDESCDPPRDSSCTR